MIVDKHNEIIIIIIILTDVSLLDHTAFRVLLFATSHNYLFPTGLGTRCSAELMYVLEVIAGLGAKRRRLTD